MFIISFAIATIGGAGFLLMTKDYNRKLFAELLSYEAQSKAIENSINNYKLSGLEKVNLVKQANELNNFLAIRKSEIDKFTFINMNSKNKQMLKKLDFIKLDNF